jgi:hypothetical protein
MEKEPIYISGADLVAALERAAVIMKEEVEKDPELAYHISDGSGLNIVPSLAVVFKFDPKTLRLTNTEISSEKRAAKAWSKANVKKT